MKSKLVKIAAAVAVFVLCQAVFILTNQQATPQAQAVGGPADITVCKIIADTQGNISNGAAKNGTFILPGKVPQLSGIPEFSYSFIAPVPTTTFATPLNLNADLIGNDGVNDSECKKYSGLELSNYFYYQEEIQGTGWLEPLYYDTFYKECSQTITLGDFKPFDQVLFNGDPSDNIFFGISDGLVDLYIPPQECQWHPFLIVLNRFEALPPVVNQAPSITLLGANPMQVVKGIVFTDPGATSTDPEDGDLTSQIQVQGAVNTSATGTYPLVYSVHDSGGLGATTTRSVVVVATSTPTSTFQCSDGLDNDGDGKIDIEDISCHTDKNPNNPSSYVPAQDTENFIPVITLTGGDMTISFGSVFADPGYTATDFEDGNITSNVVVGGGPINTNNAGQTILNYNVKDSQNLPAAQKTRNVMVQEQSHGGGGGGGGGYISVQSTPGLQITDEKVVYLGNGNAQVTWKTNLVATSQVVYGTTSHSMTNAAWENYGYPLTTMEVKDMVATHTMLVSGLQDGVAYYFRPLSANSSAQQVIGKEVSYTSAVVVPPAVAPTECNYLLEYLKIDQTNNPVEVRKLQAFLNSFDNAGLEVSGIFNQATFEAVEKFQMKYLNDVLTPWGYNAPTGYVYITTKKKVNELYCQKPFPLTATQQKEVNDTRALYLSQPEAVDTGLIGGQIQQPPQPENVVVQTAPRTSPVVETQNPSGEQVSSDSGDSGFVANISDTAKESETSGLETEGLAALSIAGMGGVVSGKLIYWLALILAILVLASVVFYFRSRRKKLLPYSMPPFPSMPSSFPESIPTQ